MRPSSKTRVFFDGLLFIAKHYGKGKLENIEIGYSGLEDFCCPEFYKGRLPYNRNNQPIEISEKQSIQFNERCNATWVDKDFFKNNFIASSKISDSDFEKICSDLNEVILPYEMTYILIIKYITLLLLPLLLRILRKLLLSTIY